MNSITPTSNENVTRMYARGAAGAAALAVAAVMAPGPQARAAENPYPTPTVSPSTSPSASPFSTSPSARPSFAPLPSDWPDAAALPQVDCSWGAPIDRQPAQQIDSSVAAVVDTRCEPPKEQAYTWAHADPSRTAQRTGRVYNTQVVRLDCQTTGQPLGDERGPSDFKNDQWFSITFKDRDHANHTQIGYVAAANLGQLDLGPYGTDVPSCSR